jgi:hypothetical protein
LRHTASATHPSRPGGRDDVADLRSLDAYGASVKRAHHGGDVLAPRADDGNETDDASRKSGQADSDSADDEIAGHLNASTTK